MSISMTTTGSIKSGSSNEMKFASRFVRALWKMRSARSSWSSMAMRKRSERIKMAAYWCMARAVGSRRGWSRAILFKLRRGSRIRSQAAHVHHHHHHHVSMMTTMRRKRKRSVWLDGKSKKKRSVASNSVCVSHHDDDDDDDDGGVNITRQANKLRKVVPGGKCMDLCSLLEETADFVRCLNTQVSIMQTIAHHYSNS